MKESNTMSNFILYTTPGGDVSLEVRMENETVWLTQKMMGDLFAVESNTVTYHIQEIFKSGELEPDSTARKIRVVQNEGTREVERELDFYNLDAIIAVGYRVNSKRATQFRIWATKVLREYIIKGFAMNDRRLKRGNTPFGVDYFNELLERIRSIRSSERRIYLQITDVFAECSTDYDPRAESTREFFATVQNKFHYAITGKTAAEIIAGNVDASAPRMGLTTWTNAPSGRILASDVTVAKNYLGEREIRRLERTISGFFDYIENLIENKRTFTMAEFAVCVDKFLSFNEYKILKGKGKLTKDHADKKALDTYHKFNKHQPMVSDFEKMLKEARRVEGKMEKSNPL